METVLPIKVDKAPTFLVNLFEFLLRFASFQCFILIWRNFKLKLKQLIHSMLKKKMVRLERCKCFRLTGFSLTRERVYVSVKITTIAVKFKLSSTSKSKTSNKL